MKNYIGYLLFLLFTFACQSSQSDQKNISKVNLSDVPQIAKIESAHKKQGFFSKDAIQFDIRIVFGGNEIINGTMIFSTDSRSGIMKLNNGDQVIYNDGMVYHNPAMEKADGVRFSAYTWSYFFLLPYKLNDPGSKWSEFKTIAIDSTDFNTQKISFGDGVGDTPDDWYLVFSNQQSDFIEYAAYIVTAGKPQAEAEKNPSAIQYSDYKLVDGIPLSTKWTFWKWNEKDGLHKNRGGAELTNFKFLEIEEEGFFNAPQGFLEK